MNLNKLWTIDPKTNQPSISLTILMSTFILAIAASGLKMFDLVKDSNDFINLFWSACALYFSRRFTFKGQSFSSEQAEEIQTKIEKETQ